MYPKINLLLVREKIKFGWYRNKKHYSCDFFFFFAFNSLLVLKEVKPDPPYC